MTPAAVATSADSITAIVAQALGDHEDHRDDHGEPEPEVGPLLGDQLAQLPAQDRPGVRSRDAPVWGRDRREHRWRGGRAHASSKGASLASPLAPAPGAP